MATWRRLAFLLCPSRQCGYLEFPGCSAHSVIFSKSTEDSKGKLVSMSCHQCTASTDTSSPFNIHCRDCKKVKAKVNAWYLTEGEMKYLVGAMAPFTEEKVKTCILHCPMCKATEFPGSGDRLVVYRGGRMIDALGKTRQPVEWSNFTHYNGGDSVCTGKYQVLPATISKSEVKYLQEHFLKTPFNVTGPKKTIQLGSDVIGISDHLDGARTDNRFCDVSFLVGEDQELVRAHKVVLASRSPVFAAMLFTNFIESKQSFNIPVPDVPAAIFRTMINFIYTSEIEIDQDNVLDVLFVSKRYQIAPLTAVCARYLRKDITALNACALFDLVGGGMEEEQVILRFIAENTEDVLKSDGWTDLSVDRLQAIVAYDRLDAEEVHLFEALRRWGVAECGRREIKADGEGLKTVLGTAINAVRYPLMSMEDIARFVTPTGLLTTRQMNQLFMYLAMEKPIADDDKEREQKLAARSERLLKMYPDLTFNLEPRKAVMGAAAQRDMVPLSTCRMQEVRYGSQTQGCLCEDPVTSKVYYIENYTTSNQIEEFKNMAAYTSSQKTRTFSLATAKKGTYHCAMGGFLYYGGGSAGVICKADLKTGALVLTSNVPSAGASFGWGGTVDTCFYCDGGKQLWVLYQSNSSGNMVVAQIDPKTLKVKKSWPCSRSQSSCGYAFLVAGFMYFGYSYSSAPINARLNLKTGQWQEGYSNALQRASYVNGAIWCPKSDRLIIHDSQMQHIYERVSRRA